MKHPRQVCTFLISDQLFGLDVRCVSEVIRSTPPSPVPLSPESLHGLVNLRGQIIPSINLHHRLGIEANLETRDTPDTSASAPSMSLVIRSKEGLLCFPIDEVGDVFEIDEDQLEPPPESLSAIARTLVESVCQLSSPSRLLILLKNEIPILPTP
jgi:purine-binding chemotaxis protein CheW